MEKWYRRLAEVPGIEYKTDPSIDRSKLPGHDAVPKIDRYEFDGKRHGSMSWPEGGSTGTSPAQGWKTQPRKGETEAQTILRQLWEALELPGRLTDYHFAIQSCHDALRGFAREEPWVLEGFERLCLLDIRLIIQYPETITPDPITINDDELNKLAAERRPRRYFQRLLKVYRLPDIPGMRFRLRPVSRRCGNATGWCWGIVPGSLCSYREFDSVVIQFKYRTSHSHRGFSPLTTLQLIDPEPFQRFALDCSFSSPWNR